MSRCKHIMCKGAFRGQECGNISNRYNGLCSRHIVTPNNPMFYCDAIKMNGEICGKPNFSMMYKKCDTHSRVFRTNKRARKLKLKEKKEFEEMEVKIKIILDIDEYNLDSLFVIAPVT